MLEVKSAWINTVRSAAGFIASFLFAILIFRFASVEEIGKYYFWASMVVFGGILFNAPAATLHYILPKKEEGSMQLAGTVMFGMLIPAALFYVVLFYGLEYSNIFSFGNPFLLGVLAAVAAVLGQSGAYLFSSFELEKSLAVSIASPVSRLLVVGMAIYFGKLDSMALAISTAMTGIVQAVFYVPYISKAFDLEALRKAAVEVLENIQEGVVYYLMNLLSSVMLWADIAFIGLFFNATLVGAYNAVGNLMKYVLTAIPGSISFFVLPLTVKRGGRGILKKGVVMLAFLLGPLMVSSTYPYPFVRAITGGFEEYAHIGLLFFPAMVVLPLQALFTQYLLGKRVKRIVLYLLGATGFNLALNYLLGVQLSYGIEGIALSSSISSLLYTLMLLKEVRQERKAVAKTILQMLVLGGVLYIMFLDAPKMFTSDLEAIKMAAFSGLVAFGINSLLTYVLFRKELSETIRVLFKER